MAASPWPERRRGRLSALREIRDFPLAVRTLRVLTTLPDDVRQAARILRILATSRKALCAFRTTTSVRCGLRPQPAPPAASRRRRSALVGARCRTRAGSRPATRRISRAGRRLGAGAVRGAHQSGGLRDRAVERAAVRRRPAPGGAGGGFLVADDPRTTDVLCGYVPAAYDYLETKTNFCEAPGCRLRDARRQSAPVETQPWEPAFCERHARLYGGA